MSIISHPNLLFNIDMNEKEQSSASYLLNLTNSKVDQLTKKNKITFIECERLLRIIKESKELIFS